MTPTELDTLIQSSVRKALNEQGNLQPQGKQFQSDEYLSMDEAAKYLKLPKDTLYGYCHNKTLSYHKRGKRNFFLRTELDVWMASGRKKSIREIQDDAMARLGKGGRK